MNTFKSSCSYNIEFINEIPVVIPGVPSVLDICVVCSFLGLIKLVSKHRAQLIYTRNTKGGDEEAAAEKA